MKRRKARVGENLLKIQHGVVIGMFTRVIGPFWEEYQRSPDDNEIIMRHGQ